MKMMAVGLSMLALLWGMATIGWKLIPSQFESRANLQGPAAEAAPDNRRQRAADDIVLFYDARLPRTEYAECFGYAIGSWELYCEPQEIDAIERFGDWLATASSVLAEVPAEIEISLNLEMETSGFADALPVKRGSDLERRIQAEYATRVKSQGMDPNEADANELLACLRAIELRDEVSRYLRDKITHDIRFNFDYSGSCQVMPHVGGRYRGVELRMEGRFKHIPRVYRPWLEQSSREIGATIE